LLLFFLDGCLPLSRLIIPNPHGNFNLDFQLIMKSCNFEEIVVFKDFDFENGVLGLDRDCFLSVVKFLGSSKLRKV
jgi:hypothetical protein